MLTKVLSAVFLLSVTTCAFAAPPAAVVKVTKLQRADKFVYQYTITNNTDVAILGVTVGIGINKLPALPGSVWQNDIDDYWKKFELTGVEAPYVQIEPSRCVPFQGMVCALDYEVDSDDYSGKKATIRFDWAGSFSTGAYSDLPQRPNTTVILPRTTSSVAELTVPIASDDYVFYSGYARLDFGGSVQQRAPFTDIVDGRFFAPVGLTQAPKRRQVQPGASGVSAR